VKRVLSISGGGMRGVIPARVLVELERVNNAPISETYNLVCGTSTGGILACLMGAGVSAIEAMDFYFKSGPRIFKTNHLRNLYSARGVIHTKYSSANLVKELKGCIGENLLLKDCKTRVMVTTVNSYRMSEMVKSWEPKFENLPAWLAARMTSAAQTYFPQAEALGEKWLDGGNVRNSPMVCALAEAVELWPGEQIELVHLGTGFVKKPSELPDGGAMFWAAEIFNTVTNADDSFDDYICRKMEKVLPNFSYHRFDVSLDKFPGMDDASKKTLSSLVKETELAIKHSDLSIFKKSN
jgi:predicted acylesterase/phospholipase RssA